MDIKSKNFNKVLYGTSFILCIVSFLTGIVGSMLLIETSNRQHIMNGITQAADNQQIYVMIIIAASIVCLASFIYLCYAVGERDEKCNIIIETIDKMYTEVNLFLIALLLGVGGTGFGLLAYAAVLETIGGNHSLVYRSYINQLYIFDAGIIPVQMVAGLAVVVGVALAAIGLLLIMSDVRKIKAGILIKTSLIGRVALILYGKIKYIYNSGSAMQKVVLITLGICLASAVTPLAPVVFILILIIAPRWIKKYEAVKKGVDEAKNGNLNYKIQVESNEQGELADLARGINRISEASLLAVKNELKNQRLKTELISNVSHDLKTPLTSMVTYLDLLKTEGLDSPNAPHYLDVIDRKTARLRQLTEDLFEAAKASSGAIPVRFEKVEMLSIINQALGELSNTIDNANLKFIINCESEKYYLKADGQLLWRALENIINNAAKYALEGSRVYVDIKQKTNKKGENPMVIMEMKNISKEPLNISPEELMERFARGDEARNTDGSGLGLSITKDLMKLQGGWFEIKIDGDLFKTVLMAQVYNSQEPESVPEAELVSDPELVPEAELASEAELVPEEEAEAATENNSAMKPET
ncbi:MAG: sensor histidine kinase [Peptostreptococcaceae bacterium]|nr:sensor histidine kinase [Peptostreptococcaceae bacterium]